jgi:acyl carrier protein phosphodiesterase
LNYIAHLHIAQYCHSDLLGNFLGDFIKGQGFVGLQQDLVLGIKLHRQVDVYTDQHPAVAALRQQFSPSIRRVAGIVIDIVFDHVLLKHWSKFANYPAEQLFSSFYAQLALFNQPISPHFQTLSKSLISQQWLASYHQRSSCLRAFKGIERRLHGKISFADQAQAFVDAEFGHFETTFLAFYPELLEHALHCKAKLQGNEPQHCIK